jgi:hypothetical protein
MKTVYYRHMIKVIITQFGVPVWDFKSCLPLLQKYWLQLMLEYGTSLYLWTLVKVSMKHLREIPSVYFTGNASVYDQSHPLYITNVDCDE